MNRQTIVKQAQSWLGCKESDGSHKKIIDIYNAHKPLARGYKVQYNDAWCATFVSACAIKCGATDIIPTECGCDNMIALFQKAGTWVEDDAYVPSAGDIIFYDWQDSGIGDNKGSSDHVGIVEKVSGKTITVIEGNKNDAVERRTIQVDGKYIRGYGVPKYDKKVGTTGVIVGEKTEKIKQAETKTAAAQSFDKSLAGTYTVKAASGLNLRQAPPSGQVLKIMQNGTKVQNYGYYTEIAGVKWMYIQVGDYTGFASEKYLTK